MFNLYSKLSDGASTGKNALQQWRHIWEQDKDTALLSILQLCIDMTGYGYSLVQEDLYLLDENVDELMKSKIWKAPLEPRNFLRSDAFIANLKDFLKHLIAHSWQELLLGHEWLNKMAKLILALCASGRDECVIASSSLAVIMALHLCSVQYSVRQRAFVLRDPQQQHSMKKMRDNIDNICVEIFSHIRLGFKFTEIVGLLTDQVCEMLVLFPYLLIEEYKQLDLLRDILAHRNKKTVQSVLKYLKTHFTDSICPTITSEVGMFILSIDNILIRVMDTFKTFEHVVIQLFIHACSVTGKKVAVQTGDRIALRMFSTDEVTSMAAIDLLSQHCAGVAHVADAEISLILAAVNAFGRYEYALSALEKLTEKLWLKGFFQQFNDVFLLLTDTLALENSSLDGKTIVHIIYHCHQLLMEDIKTRISPSQDGSNSACWGTIKMRIESFVIRYPKCLAKVSKQPDVFNLLLNCLNPDDKELYSLAGVNCEQYYVNVLYNTLTTIALQATEYPMLFRTLSTIYRFDTIIHILEDIWQELSDNYFSVFFHTRARLRTYNLGIDKKLMEDYTTSIKRLCVLLEINNTSSAVFTLANFMANDLRLLPRMQLSDEANTIFYRLYKNTLYARVYYILKNPKNCRPRQNPGQLAKQVELFMTELCAQLETNEDHTIDVGRHVVDTLCDMLLLTQPVALSNSALNVWRPWEYGVEQDVLKKLAIYLERNVFTGYSDAETASVLSAKKLMLLAYNKLYSQHVALPRLSDTAHVLKHYAECVAFTEELEELWHILWSKSPDDFYAIITHVSFEYCTQKGCYFKAKAFLKIMQTFHAKQLKHHVAADEYYSTVVRLSVCTLLEKYNESMETTKRMVCRMYAFLEPWVKPMSIETRNQLRRKIRDHPNYSLDVDNTNDAIITSTKCFLRTLKK